jgi:hypothetical protein
VTPILADSSFFVALYNRREAAHLRCIEAYRALDAPLVTCEACITEAFHILGHADAAVDAIFTSIEDGSLEAAFQLGLHAHAIGGLLRKYRDTPADFADACLIAMANQLGTGDILTLDSDFRHYRWRRNRAFNLLIPLDR